jgi:hypothetical protein
VTQVNILPAQITYDYLGRDLSHSGKVELTRATVFMSLPRGGSEQLKIEPPPAKSKWGTGKVCPVLLQLIGKGDAAQSAFQLDATNELRLVAYNFGEQAARGKLSMEGAAGETDDIEIAPGGREERTINAHGPGTLTVRLQFGDNEHAVVSGRVMTMAR